MAAILSRPQLITQQLVNLLLRQQFHFRKRMQLRIGLHGKKLIPRNTGVLLWWLALRIQTKFNRLAPGWFEWNFIYVLFQLILVIDGWGMSGEIALRWMPLDLSDDKSTSLHMMTSSNGNIFRVTGPLCGEFTGLRWIPLTKASDAELWCFLDLRLE